MWEGKRYHSLSFELKKTFGKKVAKLSIDGGFTCPNRDGTIGEKGCLFCSDEGSGEFAAPNKLCIKEQIEHQKQLLSSKWNTDKFIVYFQSFTNTYASVSVLKEKYEAAINQEGVVGIAIATRPDCLPPDVLNLLYEISQKTYLWIELGFQTARESSARLIRRGYENKIFRDAVSKLNKLNIKTVAHLIFGLPNETKEDMMKSVKFVANMRLFGIKFHLMHILRDSELYSYYQTNPFNILTKDEYMTIVCDAIELIPPECTIHRLTGDGAKHKLIAPKWSLNKLSVISGIDKELKMRGSYQGMYYK